MLPNLAKVVDREASPKIKEDQAHGNIGNWLQVMKRGPGNKPEQAGPQEYTGDEVRRDAWQPQPVADDAQDDRRGNEHAQRK